MKNLSAVMILISISLNSSAQTCQEVLNNCETAYQSQKILIKDQKEQIDNYFKKDQLNHQIIDDQQKKLDSPTRDPIKMIAVGAVGVVILEVALGAFRR